MSGLGAGTAWVIAYLKALECQPHRGFEVTEAEGLSAVVVPAVCDVAGNLIRRI